MFSLPLNANYLILNFCTSRWAETELSLENWQWSKFCNLNKNICCGKEYKKIYVHENKASKFITLGQSLCKKVSHRQKRGIKETCTKLHTRLTLKKHPLVWLQFNFVKKRKTVKKGGDLYI